MSYHQALNEAMPDMPAFPLEIKKANGSAELDLQVVVWTRKHGDPSLRLQLGEFAAGTAAGRLHIRGRGLGMAWEWSLDEPAAWAEEKTLICNLAQRRIRAAFGPSEALEAGAC